MNRIHFGCDGLELGLTSYMIADPGIGTISAEEFAVVDIHPGIFGMSAINLQ
jgi:hypothetical protein